MILLNEVAKAGPYIIVYRDSSDPYLFYYLPRFANIAKSENGRYMFGQMFFKKQAGESFSVYNMAVRGVVPGPEYQATKDELERNLNHAVSIVPVPGYDLSIDPVTTDLSFALISQRVQTHGGNLLTDLTISMTFQGWCEPEMAGLFQSDAGWTGSINYKMQGLTTPFKATITANWHRIQEHFKSQTTVSYWWIHGNLSYETQKLIGTESLDVKIEGGTPAQKDQIYAMAKTIADRLFVPSISPNPLPNHPEGGVVGLSLNYSKSEEDKKVTWTFEERDIETRTLGMAIIVGRVPRDYFHGLPPDKPLDYSLNEPFQIQANRLLSEFIVASIEREISDRSGR